MAARHIPFIWHRDLSRLLGAIAFAIGLAFSLTATHGQDSDASEPESAHVALSGEVTIQQLLELVSQRLSVSVQYAPGREMEQRVTLRLRDAMSNDELWRVLSATLEAHGLALVATEQPSLFRVTPLAQAASHNQRLQMPGESFGRGDGPSPTYVSVILRLQSTPAAELAAALAPILSNSNSLQPIGTAGLILLTDVRRRVEHALALIELLDSPLDPQVRFIVDLEQAHASDIAPLAAQILAAEAGATNQGATATIPQMIGLPGDERLLVVAPRSQRESLERLIAELDVAPSIETQSYAVPGVAVEDLAEAISRLLSGVPGGQSGESSDVFVDRATGAVIVTADERDQKRISALMKRLAEAPPAARRVIRPIRVLNRAASDLVQTVTELLDLGRIELVQVGASTTSLRAQDEGSGAEVSSAVASRNDDLTITVDEATNTIIAAGTISQIEQLESLIDLLDERQPQVMIDISLVTLSEGEAIDIGVELQGEFSVGTTSVNLSSLFGLGSGGASGPLGVGTGFTGAIVNPGDFQAIIRALESVNRGRTASSPKVLVNNNSTATLRSVARQPFTSINASNTVATTSFGGNEDAGTTVTITPQIAQGDHLILEYAIELSSFTGESTTTEGGGVIPPPSQQNTVDGSVTIPDGFTVVIGGVENTTDGRAKSRVPLIGRLPLIGWLFGTNSTSNTQDRFYVFIRASVLRDPLFEDLKQLSRQDLAIAGVDDGVPSIEPIWID